MLSVMSRDATATQVSVNLDALRSTMMETTSKSYNLKDILIDRNIDWKLLLKL